MEPCLKIYIINARTDRYNILCSIDAHEKHHPLSVDVDSSGGGNGLVQPKTSNFSTRALI